MPSSKLFYCKNSRRYSEKKKNGNSKTMARLFLIFWIRSNIFRNFSGCRLLIRLSISFPMPYSKLFYCKNSRRYGEKKTESRKWLLGFSSFFGFVQTYFAISRAVGFRFFNVYISLDSSFHKLYNAVFEIVLLQKLVKI